MTNSHNINIEKRIFNKLEKDYQSVLNNNLINNINKSEINKTIQVESINELQKQDNTQLISNKESIDKEKKLNLYNNDYYQPINSSNTVGNEDEISDNKDNKKDIIKMEPQEGFIEIKKESKNNEINDKINNEEEIMNEEFYEVEEKENDCNIKEVNKNVDLQEVKDKNKNNLSPIKNSEHIKNKMKSLNFKAPKWAENMNDIDFINMAKNIISSKNKNK